MSYTKEIYRDIILDHVENQRNSNKDINDKYNKAYVKNPSCGDEITLYVYIEKDLVKDITYQVNGCSICKASTSIMSELLFNKSIKEIDLIIENINKMLSGIKYDNKLIKDAIVFEGIKDLPPRIKCALLPYNAYKKSLGDNHE